MLVLFKRNFLFAVVSILILGLLFSAMQGCSQPPKIENPEEAYNLLQQEKPSVLAAMLIKDDTPLASRKAAARLLGEYVLAADLKKETNMDPVIALGIAAKDQNEDLAGLAREVLERIQFKDTINAIKQSTLFGFLKNPGNANFKASMPSSSVLVLDSIRDPMTEKEFNSLKSSYLLYSMPTFNFQNYHFARRNVPFMGEWLYEKAKDEDKNEILNKMIDMGKSVIDHRNDHFGQFITQYGDITPSWPHFQNSIIDGRNGYGFEVITAVSDFAYTVWASIPAKIIIKDPSLWDKSYNGRTYKEIADDFVNESMITLNYFLDKFLDKSTMLYVPSERFYPIEIPNIIPGWNRVFPVIVSMLPLIDIFEELEIHTETKVLLDKANSTFIDEFWQYAREYTVNGKSVYDYPARLDLG
ncbi:MAG TPA: hypothetical protein DD727_08445, partial [Clostridiales bacterium]|nr:hypothetical protein [Clostridiales bacterium]